MQVLYTKIYKILLKIIKEGLSKWQTTFFSWFVRLGFVKVIILPKVIYRFNIIPNKISAALLKNLTSLFPIFINKKIDITKGNINFKIKKQS